MKRRQMLAGLSLLVPVLTPALVQGHTPFQQWTVYRRKHLLILTDKTVSGSFELGQKLAAFLAESLPASKARVTRAPHTERIASLLSSGQIKVAVLPKATAYALFTGAEPFSAYGPVELYVLANQRDFLLVARADFPDHHAYQVAATLQAHAGSSGFTLLSEATTQPPLHPGVVAFLQGAAMPAAPVLADDEALEDGEQAHHH